MTVVDLCLRSHVSGRPVQHDQDAIQPSPSSGSISWAKVRTGQRKKMGKKKGVFYIQTPSYLCTHECHSILLNRLMHVQNL